MALKKFPLSPGVYLFKDNKNRVIYIGRAAYLRKRIASYFHRAASYKASLMLSEAKKINFIKTENLLEAIVLEANLIKKYWPKYNIREKDNRSFIYILIPKKEWTYPLLVRAQQLIKYLPSFAINQVVATEKPVFIKKKLKEANLFGPFRSYQATKKLLLTLRKIFPYSTCKANQGKPCFYHQINLCPGKCVDKISQEEYQKNIKALILFLQGKKERVKRILKKQAPSKLELLKNIDDSIFLTKEDALIETELLATTSEEKKLKKVSYFHRIEGYDISHFGGKETVGAMVVWQNGEMDKSEYRLFKIKEAKPYDDLSALEEMIKRRLRHKEWQYPNLILVDGGRTQVKTAENILKAHDLNIPVVGIIKPARFSVSRSQQQDQLSSDRLTFSKIPKPLQKLLSLSKPQLIKIRNEAHRFANSLRLKMLKIKKQARREKR